MEPTNHYMYVLLCADNTLYTGYTTDVEQRLCAHNLGKGAKYTSTRRPVQLLAHAAFTTKHAAMSAEFHFKQLPRDQKLALIQKAQTPNTFGHVLAERFSLNDK